MEENATTLVTGAGGTETVEQAWYPDELADKVAQKGWKEPTDAVKGYFELEKSASGKVKMPTPASSAEEISAFYARIGRPENPDGYEVAEIPGNVTRDEEFEKDIKQVAFEQGVPKVALETLMKTYYERMSERLVMMRTEGETVLKKEWAGSFDKNIEIARRACRELGGDDFIKALVATGFGNHPVFIKTFHNIGLKMLTDTLVTGSSSGGKEEYVPQFKTSPDMYRNGEDEDSKKAREYFKARGHKY